MHFLSRCTCLALLLLAAAPTQAAAPRQVRFPLLLDHAFVRNVLLEQVFTGEGQTARAWDDGRGCNRLDLSDPRVDSAGTNLRVVMRGAAVAGIAIAGRCIGGLTWQGWIELSEETWVDGANVVHFRVVDSKIYGDDEKPGFTGTLWSWTKQFVHPRLEAATVDLGRPLAELRDVLPLFSAAAARARIARVLDSLRVAEATVVERGLRLDLAFAIDTDASPPPTAAEPPLSAEELARWQNAWLQWDAFLTFVVKNAGAAMHDRDLLQELQDVFLDARHELTGALSAPTLVADPVRPTFLRTWSRLAPLLRNLSDQLPASTALHYLSFIAAADALRTFDETPELGIEISADGLRRLARLLAPASSEDPLLYSERVDPELRRIFDFGEPLPTPEPTSALQSLFWSVAWAGEGSPKDISARLNNWVPTADELGEYLPLVHTLLVRTYVETLTKHPLASEFTDLFRSLILATAWQESCWRQFVKSRGGVTPILSAAGSVGIMQINQRVWRGFYDLTALRQSAAYNAAAGAEILHQYLVRYAIKRGEHTATGKVENLARATYAVYNGGPGHLRRYREAKTKEALRAIDASFWEKFRSVRAGDEMGVASCFRPS